MAVELAQTDSEPTRLHRETDHARTEIALTDDDVEELHQGLTAILDQDAITVNGDHIMVERRPNGPDPVYIKYTRDRAFVPMHLTEAEAESLLNDCGRVLAMVIKQ